MILTTIFWFVATMVGCIIGCIIGSLFGLATITIFDKTVRPHVKELMYRSIELVYMGPFKLISVMRFKRRLYKQELELYDIDYIKRFLFDKEKVTISVIFDTAIMKYEMDHNLIELLLRIPRDRIFMKNITMLVKLSAAGQR